MAGARATKANGYAQRSSSVSSGPSPRTRPAKIAHVVSATAQAVIRRIRTSTSFAFRRHFAIGATTEPASWSAPMCARAPALASSATTPATGSCPREELMMAMSAEPKAGAARLLSLSGAGAVVLVVASFAGLGGNTPGASDSAATISAYYDGLA